MLYLNTTARIINEPQIASDYFPATTPAYRLGAYAAQLGEECHAARYFVFLQDQKDFARGYASIASRKDTVAQ